MKKLSFLLILLVLASSLLANNNKKIKSKHLKPINQCESVNVINTKTDTGRDYFVLSEGTTLEYEVPEGYEAYGFVRTIADESIEPDLNVKLNGTLSMILSVDTSKSIKFTSEKYVDLSRAKKIYITPSLTKTKIELITNHKNPVLVRMYIKKIAPENTNRIILKQEELKS